MVFDRIDDIDNSNRVRVRYILVGWMFEIRATKDGVQLTGDTPYYTDWTPIQEKLTWAQYHSQRLKETGHPINQNLLDRGEI